MRNPAAEGRRYFATRVVFASERLGVKPVLRFGHGIWAMLPLFWLLANPRNALIMIAIGSILGGISSTAATTAANKLITRYPPEGRRATYIALSSTIGSVAGGFGGFRLTFLLSLLLRNLATHVLLPRMPE